MMPSASKPYATWDGRMVSVVRSAIPKPWSVLAKTIPKRNVNDINVMHVVSVLTIWRRPYLLATISRFANLVSLDTNILTKDMTFSSDWQQAVQVLQTMRLELDALGFLAEYFSKQYGSTSFCQSSNLKTLSECAFWHKCFTERSWIFPADIFEC